jgi:dipeptidyl aminopeptidase
LDGGNIWLSKVQNMSSQTLLVDGSRVTDRAGNRLSWQSWHLSADMEYVLFRGDSVKQWRYSSFGNFFVHRLSDGATYPIHPPSHPPSASIAVWSPVGHALAFVNNNDLYVITESELASTNPNAIRVTTDGSSVVFNGVPDWVYEEEVFEGESALWWSPDGSTVAYLRSDETEVREYKLQYYNPSNDAFDVDQFPSELEMK